MMNDINSERRYPSQNPSPNPKKEYDEIPLNMEIKFYLHAVSLAFFLGLWILFAFRIVSKSELKIQIWNRSTISS